MDFILITPINHTSYLFLLLPAHDWCGASLAAATPHAAACVCWRPHVTGVRRVPAQPGRTSRLGRVEWRQARLPAPGLSTARRRPGAGPVGANAAPHTVPGAFADGGSHRALHNHRRPLTAVPGRHVAAAAPSDPCTCPVPACAAFAGACRPGRRRRWVTALYAARWWMP